MFGVNEQVALGWMDQQSGFTGSAYAGWRRMQAYLSLPPPLGRGVTRGERSQEKKNSTAVGARDEHQAHPCALDHQTGGAVELALKLQCVHL